MTASVLVLAQCFTQHRLASARVPVRIPTLRIERKCWTAGDRVVVGIDEVGRGSWAGPVTVAAVVPGDEHLAGVRDSKLLTPAEREVSRAACARLGARHRRRPREPRGVRPARHDRGAPPRGDRARSRSSRRRASSPTASCSTASTTTCGMPRQVRTIIKGDQTVLSVAAASVVAKVTRDAMMAEEAEHYPGVRLRVEPRLSGAACTSARSPAYGPSSIHRRSWIFMDYCLWGGLPRVRARAAAVLDGRRSPTCRSGRRSTRTPRRSRDHDLRDAVRRRPGTRRPACTSRPRAGISTTPSTGSPTRRCALLVALADARGLRERASTRCSAASTSTSPRTGRCCTSRCACPRDASLVVDGVDVVAEVHAVLDQMGAFAEQVRDGDVARAHRPADPQRRQHRHRRQRPRAGDGVRRAARVQPTDAASAASCRTSTAPTSLEALRGLDPAETLFIVSSKTFTTLETLTNATLGPRSGCVDALGDDDAVARALRRGVDQRREGRGVRDRHRRTCSSSGTGSAAATRCGRRSACR